MHILTWDTGRYDHEKASVESVSRHPSAHDAGLRGVFNHSLQLLNQPRDVRVRPLGPDR